MATPHPLPHLLTPPPPGCSSGDSKLLAPWLHRPVLHPTERCQPECDPRHLKGTPTSSNPLFTFLKCLGSSSQGCCPEGTPHSSAERQPERLKSISVCLVLLGVSFNEGDGVLSTLCQSCWAPAVFIRLRSTVQTAERLHAQGDGL